MGGLGSVRPKDLAAPYRLSSHAQVRRHDRDSSRLRRWPDGHRTSPLTSIGVEPLTRSQARSSGVGPTSEDACHRTTVLVSLDDADLSSDSYQLFERCARVLSTMSSMFERRSRADVFQHQLFLGPRRHSSAVEQLFRKQQVLGSNPSVGSTPIVRAREEQLSGVGRIFATTGSARGPW